MSIVPSIVITTASSILFSLFGDVGEIVSNNLYYIFSSVVSDETALPGHHSGLSPVKDSHAHELEILDLANKHKNEYATNKAREVAKRLQSPDPDQFTVYTLDQNEMRNANALNYEGSTILLSKSFSDALQGLPGAKYTSEEIEGVLGHEVGHGILRHADPDNPKNDKLDGLRGEASIRMLSQILREHEREADLFTVRDPKIAQGLVHRLMRDRIGKPPEIPHLLDTHPTDEERIAYLSRAICETTRGHDELNISCFSNGTAS